MCSFKDELPEGSGLEICPTFDNSIIFHIEGHFHEATTVLLISIIVFVTTVLIGLLCLLTIILKQQTTNHRQVYGNRCTSMSKGRIFSGGV